MRFVVTGEWSKNQLLRLIMVMFLGFVACFWIVTTLLFVEKMGFSAAGVAQCVLGDPELEFGQPARSYGSMLETSHMHLFAMGLLVMVLTHLLLFAPLLIQSHRTWRTRCANGHLLLHSHPQRRDPESHRPRARRPLHHKAQPQVWWLR